MRPEVSDRHQLYVSYIRNSYTLHLFLTLGLDLSAAVDVYSDWVDACDAVAKDTAHKYEPSAPNSHPNEYTPSGEQEFGENTRDTHNDDY